MKCIVVTPEETILEVETNFVALPLYDGEMGIGENHTPLVGRLGYGELRFTSNGEAASYYVEGGVVEVLDNTVSLLTNMAVPSSKIDIEKAKTELETALKKVTRNEDQLKLKSQNVAAARAQVHLAEKAAGSSAKH
jgi:ATP synthase, F1 epsilon subunit (delta in mitochondria)